MSGNEHMDESSRGLSLERAAALDTHADSVNSGVKATEHDLGQYHKDTLLRKKLILSHFGATDSDWESHQWQLANRIEDARTLNSIFKLAPERYSEIDSIQYRWAITPYYLSLINANEPSDEIGLMALPSMLEMQGSGEPDPMAEKNTNPAGSITRRYPDRLIINVTNACGMYCRFCQRKRNIGKADLHKQPVVIDESIDYVKKNQNIREVLITGGDPLTLTNKALEEIIAKVREIPHVKIIRISTRIPATMPQRVDRDLVDMLRRHHPLYVNTHFNHPKELTTDSSQACNLLADAGIPLGNQMVLLKGVNDNKHVVMNLNRKLLEVRVKPYYIFHAKDVQGANHFRCDLQKGLEIIDFLIGNTSGMAKPYYILNAKGGLGKVPLLRPKFNEIANGRYEITTWENDTVIYADE